MKHLCTQAIKHGEADVGAVLRWINMDTEWTFTERSINHINNEPVRFSV